MGRGEGTTARWLSSPLTCSLSEAEGNEHEEQISVLLTSASLSQRRILRANDAYFERSVVLSVVEVPRMEAHGTNLEFQFISRKYKSSHVVRGFFVLTWCYPFKN